MMKQYFDSLVIIAVSLGGACVLTLWVLYDVWTIDRVLDRRITPVDYKPLEEAVSLWNKRKSFEMPKNLNTTDSADLKRSKSESISVYSVSIKNGSDVTGAALSLAEKLKNVEGISISETVNTKKTSQTVFSYKNRVSKQVIKAISNILNDTYGAFSITSLSERAENDIEITIGTKAALDR